MSHSPYRNSSAQVDPLETAAATFPEADASLLAHRELLHRIDSKFVCTRAAAVEILRRLAGQYAALRVPAGNVALYQSLYFDTADRRCFHDHRRGRRVRHKIRIRHYPDRQLSFLEVKTKQNDVVTDKHRLALPYGHERLDGQAPAFLADRTGLGAAALGPMLRVEFRRISLVGLASHERVTMDLDLGAESPTGAHWRFGDGVVIEVKQASFCVRTPVMGAVREAGLREQSLSKYTVATAAMYPELRINRLRPDLRAIERIRT